MNRNTPAEEDPVVHGYLTALRRPEPRPGLANRVLVNVWQPKPRWLRRFEASYADLVESGRIWFVLGAFAAGSLIPVAASVALVWAWGNQLAWGADRVVPDLWAGIVAGWQAAVAEVSAVWNASIPGTDLLMTAAIVTVVTTVICSVGLYRMVRIRGKMRS